MRSIGFVKSALSHPQFEVLEDRMVMSAQPVADFYLDYQVQQQAPPLEQMLASAHGLTGLTAAQNAYGFDGRGQTVVVIDSGIAWDHVDLGGGFGAGYRVVGGWDFTEENDANPYDDGPGGAHGTHVAGIIGSSHTVHSGVAAGVDLVSLRVFNDAGQGYFSWVEDALQWVHQNRNSFQNPITTVNLSLGTSWNSQSLPNWASLEDEFAQLEADGIFISVAAGNAFATYQETGLSYPAVSRYVVPVASVDDNGQFSSYSQRDERVIAAPGRNITSTVPDYVGNFNRRTDDFLALSGTSMAAPYVAGASVLLRQAFHFAGHASVTQDQIYEIMRQTADIFHDPATGANYHRLNLAAALDAIMPEDDFGATRDAAFELGRLAEENPLALTGVFNTLNDVDYFTFTAAANGRATVTIQSQDNSTFTAEFVGDSTSAYADGMLSFDVVAGKSYGIVLSGGGALGHYDIGLSLLAAAEPPVNELPGEQLPDLEPPADGEFEVNARDVGEIDWQIMSGESFHQDAWYRVVATRDGLLTAQASSLDQQQPVSVQFYSVQGNELLATSGIGSARADLLIAAGDELLIHVGGADSGDLLLANIVEIHGSEVTIHGSANADRMTFRVGTIHRTTINDVTYQFDAKLYHSFAFEAGAGHDRFDLIGSNRNETVRMAPGHVQFDGVNLTVTADHFESHYISGKGGTDTAIIAGTAGADRFYSRAYQSWMIGAGFYHKVYQFENIHVVPSAGADRAYLDDDSGRLVVKGHAKAMSFVRPDATITIGQRDLTAASVGPKSSPVEVNETPTSHLPARVAPPADSLREAVARHHESTAVASSFHAADVRSSPPVSTGTLDPQSDQTRAPRVVVPDATSGDVILLGATGYVEEVLPETLGDLAEVSTAIDVGVQPLAVEVWEDGGELIASSEERFVSRPAEEQAWAEWSGEPARQDEPSGEAMATDSADALFERISELLDEAAAYAAWLTAADRHLPERDGAPLALVMQSAHLFDFLPPATIR